MTIRMVLKILLASLLVSLLLLASSECAMVDHCYSDLGCFPLGPEFYHPKYRPFNARPWHRNRIKTRFELYNRRYPDGILLEPWNRFNLQASGFDPALETKVLIPGWLDSIKRTVWIKRAKDSFLWLWHPVNIVVVHWRNFTPYTIATANTRVVGAELANLIKWIEHELNYDRSYYHLIGHSLGAHISGYCGDRLPGLGRITALDPARPFFQHMPKSVRLDRGDALFVDAIHSDFTPENAILLLMSFGMTTPVGHVDFYPNGPPLLQPGCLRDTFFAIRDGIRRGLEYSSLSVAFLEAIRYLTACDHQRSHEWFVESIINRQCIFVGVRCNDFDGLIDGRCTCKDSPSACAIMGIHADQMYLNKLHNDIWPLQELRNELGQYEAQPHWDTSSEYLDLASTPKDKLYSELKHLAQVSSSTRYPKSRAPSFDELLLTDFGGLQDPKFINYLLSNFVSLPDIGLNPSQDGFESLTDLPDPFMGFEGPPLSHRHPPLMSDFHRNIEQWYEDSSRWYLKTNHRPSYCVNQYQVLVHLGPLVTKSGHDFLKANLIITIIGSRGQLMNQRFVPRAKKLSSFTLQPFFIILEGSYRLGEIISVAVAWESRHEPDPIKASADFHSRTLEVVPSVWSENLTKDLWLSASLNEQNSLLDRPASFESDHDFNSNVKQSDELILPYESKLDSECLQFMEIKPTSELFDESTSPSEILKSIGLELGGAEIRTRSYQDKDLKAMVEAKPNSDNLLSLTEDQGSLFERTNWDSDSNEAQESVKLDRGGLIDDLLLYDSIIIRQVTINPITSTHGSKRRQTGKTFCPPHPNFRLHQDQTTRLQYRLVEDCN